MRNLKPVLVHLLLLAGPAFAATAEPTPLNDLPPCTVKLPKIAENEILNHTDVDGTDNIHPIIESHGEGDHVMEPKEASARAEIPLVTLIGNGPVLGGLLNTKLTLRVDRALYNRLVDLRNIYCEEGFLGVIRYLLRQSRKQGRALQLADTSPSSTLTVDANPFIPMLSDPNLFETKTVNGTTQYFLKVPKQAP